jgi:hypothetical protein
MPIRRYLRREGARPQSGRGFPVPPAGGKDARLPPNDVHATTRQVNTSDRSMGDPSELRPSTSRFAGSCCAPHMRGLFSPRVTPRVGARPGSIAPLTHAPWSLEHGFQKIFAPAVDDRPLLADIPREATPWRVTPAAADRSGNLRSTTGGCPTTFPDGSAVGWGDAPRLTLPQGVHTRPGTRADDCWIGSSPDMLRRDAAFAPGAGVSGGALGVRAATSCPSSAASSLARPTVLPGDRHARRLRPDRQSLRRRFHRRSTDSAGAIVINN